MRCRISWSRRRAGRLSIRGRGIRGIGEVIDVFFRSNSVFDRYDLLVSFEIRELAPSGEYLPAVVDHSDGVPCSGTFILHQGMQRRIVITIAHERGAELQWTEVRELLVGRVRACRDGVVQDEMECEGAVISLAMFAGQNLVKSDDDRSFYRFEAAWDSSLHNSPTLNRLSGYGETVCRENMSNLIKTSFPTARHHRNRLSLNPRLHATRRRIQRPLPRRLRPRLQGHRRHPNLFLQIPHLQLTLSLQ